MNLIRQAWLLAACGAVVFIFKCASAAESCTTDFRLPLVLRIAAASSTNSVRAFLIGNLTPGLRIVDSSNRRVLWSAAATGTPTQQFAGMTAGFSSSLAALDTDGDGAHDRIYAGDLQGRLWRFDIDTRGAPGTWVAGGIFADLSGAPGRGFLAAPDLTLISQAGTNPWLSIALGTANTAPGAGFPGFPNVLNRFYVLRDRAPLEGWSQSQYNRWRPLVEADLRLAEGEHIDATADGAGFYVNLGARQVVASSLTVNAHTYYSAVATTASLLPSCSDTTAPVAPISVAAISAQDGSLTADLNTTAIRAVPANSAVTLVQDQGDPTTGFKCAVAGHTLRGCSVDSTLHRSFWRREDAD